MTLQTMSFIFGAILLAVGILGGGFEVKELKVSNVTTTARLLAGVAGIVFVILGFWQPGLLVPSTPTAVTAATPTAVTPTAVAAVMGEREHDTDRFGGDYTGFDIKTDHVELCEDACKTAAKCIAWTYVKPGVQAPQARCYLKSVAPMTSANACCVSGAKVRR